MEEHFDWLFHCKVNAHSALNPQNRRILQGYNTDWVRHRTSQPPPCFLRAWGASPVYHTRRSFRLTPSSSFWRKQDLHFPSTTPTTTPQSGLQLRRYRMFDLHLDWKGNCLNLSFWCLQERILAFKIVLITRNLQTVIFVELSENRLILMMAFYPPINYNVFALYLLLKRVDSKCFLDELMCYSTHKMETDYFWRFSSWIHSVNALRVRIVLRTSTIF